VSVLIQFVLHIYIAYRTLVFLWFSLPSFFPCVENWTNNGIPACQLNGDKIW
jgi:hypothetical protein